MNPEIETFLQSWRSLLEQGTTAGLGFTDKQHVVMLLAALPSTWRPFVTTQSYQTQPLAVLINKMRQEYTFSKLSNDNLNQSTILIAMATTIPRSNQHHNNHIDSTNLSGTIIKTITTTKIKEHLFVITATDQVSGRKIVEPSKETNLIIKAPKQ